MAISYIVSHPKAQWYRYRRLCGINTTRGVSEYTGMGTEERAFKTLEDAQAYVSEQCDETNSYRTRIPTNPRYGAEYSDMRWRNLRREDCTITVEGA